jgi:subtilisin family serine protease
LVSHDSAAFAVTLAGTIGAKNQGKGIVGVAPGIGIYALRVLHADGNGLLSDLLRAYDHLVANARQLGIRVVNLSLSGAGRSTDEDCRYITELVQQGITVVTAAGVNGSRYEKGGVLAQVFRLC